MAITAIISVCLKDLPACSSWVWGQSSGRWSLKNTWKGWGEKCISTVRVKTCVEVVECLLILICCYCSVTKSCPFSATSWMAARQASLSSTIPGSLLKSCPLSQWCYLTISSSAAPYSFAFSLSQHQSFPMSWVFITGSQSIGTSASASVLMNIQGWFPFGLTSLISLPGTLKSLLQHHSSKALILWHSAFFMVQLTSIHNYWKNYIALTIWTFVGKVMSLLFKMLSRFVITFLPRSKHFQRK